MMNDQSEHDQVSKMHSKMMHLSPTIIGLISTQQVVNYPFLLAICPSSSGFKNTNEQAQSYFQLSIVTDDIDTDRDRNSYPIFIKLFYYS